MGKRDWFAALPLNDERDLLSRIGFRYVWCMLSYLMVMLTINPRRGSAVTDLRLMDWFFIAVPIVGGLLDWMRLQYRSNRRVSATADSHH